MELSQWHSVSTVWVWCSCRHLLSDWFKAKQGPESLRQCHYPSHQQSLQPEQGENRDIGGLIEMNPTSSGWGLGWGCNVFKELLTDPMLKASLPSIWALKFLVASPPSRTNQEIKPINSSSFVSSRLGFPRLPHLKDLMNRTIHPMHLTHFFNTLNSALTLGENLQFWVSKHLL